jgi:hypothetical protein
VSPTIDNPQEITTIHFAGVIRQTPATRERVKLARNILIRRHSSMVPRCSESLGFDDNLQRAVRENCKVLKFKNAEFENQGG